MAVFTSTLPLPGTWPLWAAGMGLRCLPGGNSALSLAPGESEPVCVQSPACLCDRAVQRCAGLQRGEGTCDLSHGRSRSSGVGFFFPSSVKGNYSVIHLLILFSDIYLVLNTGQNTFENHLEEASPVCFKQFETC